jgi:hypothetical protein
MNLQPEGREVMKWYSVLRPMEGELVPRLQRNQSNHH